MTALDGSKEANSHLRTSPHSSEATDRLIALAETVFGSHEKAESWLRSQYTSGAGTVPEVPLLTGELAARIESMIWAIDEGIYT